jgi:hypothetical protein
MEEEIAGDDFPPKGRRSDERVPALFLLSELWTAAGAHGLVSALCGSCAGKPDLTRRIAAGLKQDLNADPDTMRIIEKEGWA